MRRVFWNAGGELLIVPQTRNPMLELAIRCSKPNSQWQPARHTSLAPHKIDNPLMPNYKYVPVVYHSRASPVCVPGTSSYLLEMTMSGRAGD